MTDTSELAGHTGSDALRPTEGEKVPPFLSADGRAAQVVEPDFRLGHVLAQTFSILRRHAVPFLLLYLIASLLLNVPVTFTDDDSPVADVVIAMVVAQALYLVFCAFGAAVIDAAIDDMRGRPVDMAKSLRVALRRFFPVLAVTIIVVFLAILGFVVIAFLAAMIISSYFVVVPVCLVEGLGPMQSLRRSAELTRGHRWRIFALWFSILVAEIVVQIGLDQAMRPLGSFALVLAPQVAWDALVGAFAAVLMAVTYRDLRVVKEGIEPDQIATVFD